MTEPNYTYEVKRVADEIRSLVRNLTISELIALRDTLKNDWPIDPLAGVREPRNPHPPEDEDAIALEEE